MNGSCIPPETLAAFAAGALKRHEIPPVLAHLEGCARCLHAVEQTSNLIERGRSRSQWLAIAAMIAVVIAAVPILRIVLGRQARSPISRLVALSPQDARILEPRLSGGFAYAPYEGPMRSNTAATDPQRLKLAG